MQFSRRFKTEEVWPEALLTQKPELRGKTLYDVLFATPAVTKFPVAELAEDQLNDESRELGFYLQKGLFEEYAGLVAVTGMTLRHLTITTKRAVYAGRSLRAKRPSGATAKATTLT